MMIKMEMTFSDLEELKNFLVLQHYKTAGPLVGVLTQTEAPAPLAYVPPAEEKKTRGRPKKEAATAAPAPSAPAPVAPVPAAPAAPAPAALAPAVEPQNLVEKPEKEQVIYALTTFRNKNGKEAVIALLKKHGGENSLTSVPVSSWPALYTEAKAGV